jgi:hypothetical protein
MSQAIGVKACSNCASAKRKCGKEKGGCLRCKSRRLQCHYPAKQPSNFVPYEDEAPAVESSVVSFNNTYIHSSYPDLGEQRHRIHKTLFDWGPPRVFAPVYKNQTNWWFASPDTWSLDCWERGRPQVSFSTAGFNRILAEMHRWLAQWVNNGSNPFIHEELYKYRFPRCIQDAYTTLTCYLHKSPADEVKINRIIEERAKELVEQEAIYKESWIDDSNTFDSLEQLARAQALLIYQLIGLHDGNIRLRYLAEMHIPVLNQCIQRLVDQAHGGICYGKTITLPPIEEANDVETIQHKEDNLFWHSWIVAESIRRTWLITAGIQGTYLALQRSSSCCIGGQRFTARQGFWEAPSAEIFEKRCSKVYSGFIRLTQADQLFLNISPKEISPFAKVVLECTYGIDQMKNWGIQV